MEQEQDSSYKSRFFNFIGMHENGPRQSKTLGGDQSLNIDDTAANNQAPQQTLNEPPSDNPQEQPQPQQQTNWSLHRSNVKNAKPRKDEVKEKQMPSGKSDFLRFHYIGEKHCSKIKL